MSEAPSAAKPVEQSGTTTSTQDVRAKSSDAVKPEKIPDEPYILSCPSSRPYNMRPEYMDNWRIDGLFEPNEERLQYQTFLWRDPTQTLFHIRTPKEDESRRREDALKTSGGFRSGPGTPALLPTVKKKITLSDYKNRSTTPALRTPAEGSKSDTSNPAMAKEAAPSTLPANAQPANGKLPEKVTVQKEQTTTNGSEAQKDDIVPQISIRKPETTNTVPEVVAPATVVPVAAATESQQIASSSDRNVALKSMNRKRAIDSDVAEDPKVVEKSSETSKAPPVKKPRLGTAKEQPSIRHDPAQIFEVTAMPAIEEPKKVSQKELMDKREMPKGVTEEAPKGLGADVPGEVPEQMPVDKPEKETSRASGVDLLKDVPVKADGEKSVKEKESRTKSNTADASNPRGKAGPNWIPAAEKSTSPKSKPTSSPSQLHGSTAKVGKYLHWIPGAQSLKGHEELPLSLPEVPPRHSVAGSTGDNGARQTSHSPSTSESLKLSTTSSRTSHSSHASSVADSDPLQRKGTPQAISKKSIEKGLLTGKSDKQTISKEQARTPHVSGKRVPSDMLGTHQSPSVKASVVNESVKATAVSRANDADLKKREPAETVPPTNAVASDVQLNLVVKLKYGKSHSKDVRRILQLPARKEPVITTKIAEPLVKAVAQTGIAQPASKDSVKKGEKKDEKKRIHDEPVNDSERPTKRKKVEDQKANTTPRTPSMAAVNSPLSVPASTSLHRQLLTPKKDKLGRLGVPAPKPSTPQSSLATPNAASIGDPPSGSSSNAIPEHKLPWKAEFEKQLDLARTLKRKMQAFMMAKEDDTRADLSPEMKKVAVEGLESTLAFMQAFAALGEYDRNSNIKLVTYWDSLKPLFKEVCGACHHFDHLRGMSQLLRSLCCSVLAAMCTNVAVEELKKVKCLGPTDTDVLNNMMANIKHMQLYAVQAERSMKRTTIAAEYPLSYVEYQKIPVGLMLNPMIAVRIGCRFLEEWTLKQKLDWKMQLEEGLCSQL